MGMRLGSAHGLGAHTRWLLISALAVALLVTLGASSASAATSATCSVANPDSGRTYTRLQQAVDAAKPGAHLIVMGTCHGGTFINKDLAIVGKSTKRTGKAVLDGDGKARVLVVKPGVKVSIRSLTIRKGVAKWTQSGGAISNRGKLTLRDVIVRKNRMGSLYNEGRLQILGRDKVVRKERPTELANRKSRPGMTAMVATNGERSIFGRSDAYAAPLSTQISGGEFMVAQACARPMLGIDSSGQARIGDVRVNISATLPGRTVAKQIQRVNTHRDDTAVVLFTNRFGRSTKTAPGGIEVVLGLQHRLGPGDSQTMKVLEVRRGAGNTRLRAGQAVLSVKGDKNG